jgi:hypothetical protein
LAVKQNVSFQAISQPVLSVSNHFFSAQGGYGNQQKILLETSGKILKKYTLKSLKSQKTPRNKKIASLQTLKMDSFTTF